MSTTINDIPGEYLGIPQIRKALKNAYKKKPKPPTGGS